MPMSPEDAERFARAILDAYQPHQREFAVELASEEVAIAVAEAFRRLDDCDSVVVNRKRVEVKCR